MSQPQQHSPSTSRQSRRVRAQAVPRFVLTGGKHVPQQTECSDCLSLTDASLRRSRSVRAWEAFLRDRRLRRRHRISRREMAMLSGIALQGEVRDSDDFIYMLNTLRAVLRS